MRDGLWRGGGRRWHGRVETGQVALLLASDVGATAT